MTKTDSLHGTIPLQLLPLPQTCFEFKTVDPTKDSQERINVSNPNTVHLTTNTWVSMFHFYGWIYLIIVLDWYTKKIVGIALVPDAQPKSGSRRWGWQ
jgi:hypothetical protein